MDNIIITIELTGSEVDSIWRFFSRSYFDIFKALSTSEAEAYHMRDSLYKIWDAMEAGQT